MQDRQLATNGLAMIAGITRGSMFTSIGTGTNVFQRIAKEMTAYYLLSAEPAAEDRDGRPHRIKVAVNRKDVNIRARREFTLGKERRRLRHPRSVWPPSCSSRCWLRSCRSRWPPTTCARRVRPPSRWWSRPNLAATPPPPKTPTVAYVVLTDKGKVAGTSLTTNKAAPVRTTAPGPLQATTIIEVPPGKYLLRLAVLDASGRAGSVEHPLDAGLSSVGDMEIADLLLAPANAGTVAAVRLVADTTIDDEPFGAYLELYSGSTT